MAKARKPPTSSSSSSSSSARADQPPHELENEDVGDEEADSHNNDIASYIPSFLGRMVIPYHGDFCISAIFHPQLVVQLIVEGFLPMAVQTTSSRANNSNTHRPQQQQPQPQQQPHQYLFLPKLHASRCVVPLHPQSELHVSRSVRKKAKHYSLTLNTHWDQVVDYCRQQHGSSCWLYPPLVQAFFAIYAQPQLLATVSMTNTRSPDTMSTSSPSSASRQTPLQQRPQHHLQQPPQPQNAIVSVRMFSVEVWDDRTQELVAGELGYTIGDCMYTSLTGFTRQDGAGSVQLAAWGRLLEQHGFVIWDLGMDMPYKRQLGAQLWARPDFVSFVHAHRGRSSSSNNNHHNGVTSNPLRDAVQQPINCQTILQPAAAETLPHTASNGLSTTNPKHSPNPTQTSADTCANGEKSIEGSRASAPTKRREQGVHQI